MYPIALLLALVAAPTDEPKPKGEPPQGVALFDGKTLDGWRGDPAYWSVKDGMIVGKSEGPVKVSTYLMTKADHRDFRLSAKVKLVQSEMHSGISLWGKNAPEHGDPFTYAGHLVMFPSGWGLYDLFGRGGLPPSGEPAKKVGRQHEWNDLEILAVGDRLRVAVNGVEVMDYKEPLPDRIKPGPIGLQLHSNTVPQEVHFKDLILETKPKLDRLLSVKVDPR